MLKTLPRFEECHDSSKCGDADMTQASLVFLNLLAAGEAASRFEGAFLAGHNLSHGRMILLWLLDDSATGILRSSELAELAGVSRATITGLLDSLERDKLVERFGDPSDRRAISVRLTPGGKSLLDSLIPPYFQRVSQALASLSDSEQRQLISLLSKAQEAFLAVPNPSAP